MFIQRSFCIASIKNQNGQKKPPSFLKNLNLFVDLLSFDHAFLLGSLLGNLAVVVRLCRAGCGKVGGDLRLDGVDGAATLVLLDGLSGKLLLLVTGHLEVWFGLVGVCEWAEKLVS